MSGAGDKVGAAPEIDIFRRFVRITRRRPDGFVEFDFAMGEPELFVELVLPDEAFHAFCAANKAEPFPEPPSGGDGPPDPNADADDWGWRLADARATPFR